MPNETDIFKCKDENQTFQSGLCALMLAVELFLYAETTNEIDETYEWMEKQWGKLKRMTILRDIDMSHHYGPLVKQKIRDEIARRIQEGICQYKDDNY